MWWILTTFTYVNIFRTKIIYVIFPIMTTLVSCTLSTILVHIAYAKHDEYNSGVFAMEGNKLLVNILVNVFTQKIKDQPEDNYLNIKVVVFYVDLADKIYANMVRVNTDYIVNHVQMVLVDSLSLSIVTLGEEVWYENLQKVALYIL